MLQGTLFITVNLLSAPWFFMSKQYMTFFFVLQLDKILVQKIEDATISEKLVQIKNDRLINYNKLKHGNEVGINKTFIYIHIQDHTTTSPARAFKCKYIHTKYLKDHIFRAFRILSFVVKWFACFVLLIMAECKKTIFRFGHCNMYVLYLQYEQIYIEIGCW